MAITRGGTFFKLDGLRGFERELEQRGQAIRDNAAKGCEQTAINVEARASQLVPKDRLDLQRAITRAGRGIRWRVGLNDERVPSRGGQNSAHLNPWVYGQFQEYGTRNHDAQPFMGPAAESEAVPHEQRMFAALKDAVA